uniref:Uncharacterized protein n=1 Tax=Anguilla anguilla TaxID=7936 RepID=A0A0E9SX91_ANGAN
MLILNISFPFYGRKKERERESATSVYIGTVGELQLVKIIVIIL